MSIVNIDDRGEVRHVVLNRADKRNSFNTELVDAVGEALTEAANDSGVRVVVIRGEGPVFSAGMDIKELASLASTPERLREFRARAINAWNLAETMTKPTVAQIHGVCIGGAMELALACDLRVVTTDSRMSLPEVKLGLLPDVGGSSRLPAVVGLGIAKELILTGREFGGEEAGRIGFANRVVPADQLDTATEALTAELASNFATPVGLAKRVMDASARPALSTTLEMEVVAQEVSVAALAAAMRDADAD
ncbi:MAG: enoyl-CoA hydratase/isomerase family protein [Thermoleophilaceae bacterium]|nr:enoyl-CoA hydratase/isomerase family protein [Thermoleophilaceae bacterium]